MLEFPSQDAIEVYAGKDGFIYFKSAGTIQDSNPQTVKLTIGQFRAVVKNAQVLIDEADALKGQASFKIDMARISAKNRGDK